MNFFVSEVVTAPTALPISVAAADESLAAAVVEELERLYLWRAIVRQERRIVFDGALPQRLEFEPVSSIVSFTRWEPARFPMRKFRGRGGVGSEDTAEVIPADTYNFVSRDPQGTIIAPAPGKNWPPPLRPLGSFTLNYECGWTVTPESAPGAGDAVNEVPASVRLMVSRAVDFRSVSGGLGDLSVGALDLGLADSYKTDAIPLEIRNIARSYFYRPGIFVGVP